MEDKDILVKWYSLKEPIKTIGHQMPDGWWYVFLPLFHDASHENSWHFVPDSDVKII